MEQNEKISWGAKMERARVKAASSGTYSLESYDRPGFKATGIPAVTGVSCQAGDKVYCFLFDDGTGIILAKI